MSARNRGLTSGYPGSRLLPSRRQALAVIQQCRTQTLGTAAIHCHDCESHGVFPLSCGHRFCPQCQHEAGETWLERQRAKLLPVDYDLITFTLPETLRALVYGFLHANCKRLIRLLHLVRRFIPPQPQGTATAVLQTVRGNSDGVDLPRPRPSEISGTARGGGPGDGDATRATPSPPASGHSRQRGALGSESGACDAIPANTGRMEPCSGR